MLTKGEIKEIVRRDMKVTDDLWKCVENSNVDFIYRIGRLRERIDKLEERLTQVEKEKIAKKEKTAKKSSLLRLVKDRVFKSFS